MTTKAAFSIAGRNPDVLTCIANLSSDEVPTPPEIANQMLDQLDDAWKREHEGRSIWSDKTVRILDPFTKSGVFLREATSKFITGLELEIPDLQTRVDHILKNQIFGIGITSLTSLLSRRSLYCSKSALSEHSVTKVFDSPDGNIWFDKLKHTWVKATGFAETVDASGLKEKKGINGKCKYCGAPQVVFDRDEILETHAYAFIHTDNIKSRLNELFGEEMHFDVVIGNPPYQMTDAAGGGVDASIYHLFVNMAKTLEPRYLSMIIPSRWMGGATRGVGDFNGFRDRMLTDTHLRSLTDFPDSREVFPGVTITGGVCHFLWDSTYTGSTEVTTVRDGQRTTATRKLDEFDVFVRDATAVKILKKIQSHNEPTIIEIMTADTPFGISSNFSNHHPVKGSGDVALYFSRKGKRDVAFIKKSEISKNVNLIDKWKVLTPSGYDGGQKIPFIVLGKPWIAPPESVCTQTFLAFYVDSEAEAQNLETYYRSKFFRFLVSLRKMTQNGFRSTYAFVPMQDFSKPWNDQELFEKYKLTKDECEFVEALIRPMISSEADI